MSENHSPGFSNGATSSQPSIATQPTTTNTTTTNVQRDTSQHLSMFGGETIQVPHHIQHVNERSAIKSFHEQARRKATNKYRDKKHYRQQIVNHTNNNLVVNLTNHELESPLKSMLSKRLKFIPTPDKTCLKTIVNSFKQFKLHVNIDVSVKMFLISLPLTDSFDFTISKE